MRITNEEQLDQLEKVITRQNVEGCKQALKDGITIWVFQTKNEVEDARELTEEEQSYCIRRFNSGEKWAGIFRRPTREELGITPISGCDTHGNSRSSGGGTYFGH